MSERGRFVQLVDRLVLFIAIAVIMILVYVNISRRNIDYGAQ